MTDEANVHWHGWCPKCRTSKRTDIAGPDGARCWWCGLRLEDVVQHPYPGSTRDGSVATGRGDT